MRRIGMGMAAGLAIWFGSAAIAEAQSPTITPTGPLSVRAADSSSTFTATITLTTPATFAVKLWVYKNSVQYHMTTTVVPNPGTTTYNFSKLVDMSAWGLSAGDVLTYTAKLCVGGLTYNANDWILTVLATRPSKTYQKSKPLALQSQATDRRREE
jgi:hypothetical protein